MSANLIFAIGWLIVGVGILAFDFSRGGVNWKFDLQGLRLTAWIAFGFAAYNLLRWWMVRSARAQQREAAKFMRRREESLRRERSEEEPNPDFDFKDPPRTAE